MSDTPLPYTTMVDDDWTSYVKFRPSYPPSLWSSWLDYHDGPLHSIQDVGCGGGVASLGLLQELSRAHPNGSPSRASELQHIVLTDPGAANIAQAQALLAPVQARLTTTTSSSSSSGQPSASPDSGPRFTFHVARAEDALPPAIAAPGTLDFVMACECLHWTDTATSLPAMAASLRPGGTLAVVYYNSYPSIRQERAARALEAVFMARYVRMMASGPGPGGVGLVLDRGLLQSCTGLDFVPLDESLWMDVRRVFVNMARGTTWPMDDKMRELADHIGLPASRIREGEEDLRWVEQDPAWEKKACDVEFFKGCLLTMPEFFDESEWETEEWKAFESIVEEFGGKVDIFYAVSVILARKR